MPNALNIPIVPDVCEGTPAHPGKEDTKPFVCQKQDHDFPPEQDVADPKGGNLTAVLTGFKTFVLEDRSVPVPKGDEILIRVMATGM